MNGYRKHLAKSRVILKCPHCGGNPILMDYGPMSKTVVCASRNHKTRVMSKYKSTKTGAVIAWNDREIA